MNNVNLFIFAEQLAAGLNSLYRGIRYDRARLSEFMDSNDWFGFAPEIRDKEPYITDREYLEISDSLKLWLSAFKQSDEIKLDLLLSHFEPVYPQTCSLYREFAFAGGVRGNAHTWKLLDFIFAHLGKEITACDESDIESFIQLLDSESSLASARMFADFLQFIKISEWDYRFDSRGKPDTENGAYPLQDFAVMAYCVFNEEMWERQNLILKAASSPQFADLWLHTAMQFVCALRGTDMARLPAPQLPYDPKQVIEDILSDAFPEHFAAALTDELIFRLEMKSAKPSKTEAYQNIAELKLFIPESLRVPLGTVIAIALTHHPDTQPGSQFIFPGDYRRLYKQFFGAEFAAAMGKRQLSVRRCNKSYLQGIDMVTSLKDEPGKPKGYILAALARSHKGGFGTLPEITDIYLKDANFTGYSPEFIAREMFERGVFSFIPNALLEIYTGEDYKLLPIHSQTLLIGEVGLAPSQIENLLTVAESSWRRARDTVATLINRSEMDRGNIGAVLQNIASGNAPGRISECLCLMTAAGQLCPYPDRAGCIGCGYEILTKSALRLLMREFSRLKRLRKEAPKGEVWRYTALLNEAAVPAINEIISCAKALAPDADISLLLDIVEGGVNNGCSARRIVRELQPHDGHTAT